MKRIILMLIGMFLLLSFLSCSDLTEYDVMEVNSIDAALIGDHTVDITLKDDMAVRSNVESHRTINIDDTSYSLDYSKSVGGYLYRTNLDLYEYREDGKTINMAFNSDNGRMDRMYLIDENYVTDSKEKDILTKEECIAKAKEYLSEYVDDATSYVLESEGSSDIDTKGLTYSFVFVRVINELETSDTASIGITQYGDVFAHNFRSLGELKGVKAPSEKELEKMEKAVKEKLDGIYSEEKEEYDITYEIDGVLTKLSDSRVAMDYFVEVTLVSNSDASQSIHNDCRFLIALK